MTPISVNRGRWFGGIAICCGCFSLLALRPSADFPTVAITFSLVGLVAGGIALITKAKGKLAALLAICGLLVSSALPVFMLLLYLGFLGGLFVSH
jgi:hypothetical protein